MKLRILLAVFAVATFISDAGAQSRQPPQQNATTEQRHTSNYRGTPEQPLVVDIAPAPDATERAEQERRDREIEAVNAGRNLTLTLAIALFAAAQCVIAGLAVFTTYKQLRAYALVTESRLFGIEDGADIEVIYKLKNTGQTPAQNVQLTANYAFEPPDISDFTLVGPYNNSSGLIGPGEHMTYHFVIPREEMVQNKDAVASGAKCLFVFGEYFYTTVFGTRQRGKFRLHLVVQDRKAMTHQLATCNDGNSTT